MSKMNLQSRNISDIHSYIIKSLSPWYTRDEHDWNILTQFPEESDHIGNLMKRTLSHRESNSALIIGQRGCGKSALMKALINKLKKEGILEDGIVVRLNGLVQTDHQLALKEIMRQMNMNGEDSCKLGSFAENLLYVLKSLNSDTRELCRPILFILDEFDLFCHHKNQALLYNLFDISQSAQAPICVIGLTCRLDIIELLEKRVKSRFSHRQIYLFCHDIFEQYLNVCYSLLKVDPLESEEAIEKAWNDSIDNVLEDSDVISILKRQYCLSRDIRTLKSFLIMAVLRLNPEEPWLKLEHFKQSHILSLQDSKILLIQGLSILQLSLMVAMKHLSQIYDGQPFNFEMVYHQYSKLSEKYSSMSAFERPVVFKAFEQLLCLELIQALDQTKHSVQREYRLMRLLVLPDHIDEAVATLPLAPTFLTHLCSTVI